MSIKAEVTESTGTEQLDVFADSGAEGSGNGQESLDGSSGDVEVKAAAEALDMPDDFFTKSLIENDPELKAEITDKAKGDNKGSEEAGAEGKDSGAKSVATEKDGAVPAEEEDSGKETEAAPFADDLIPGLKGEVIGKMPEEAQEALARFYGEVTEKTRQAENAMAAVKALEQDPYLKFRIEAARTGVAIPTVSAIPAGFADDMVAELAKHVGLTGEEAELAAEIVKERVEAMAKMANDYAIQQFNQRDAISQAVEVNRQGDALMLGLSQFDKGLAVKETDIAKFYKFENGKTVYNDRHPEIETFKNGIGRFIEWACAHGIDNRMAVKMGAKAFYAAAAADLGKPVALNSAERDKNIAAKARKDTIDLLRKPRSGALATQGSAPATKGSGERSVVNGMDAVRLVQDAEYYDAMINRKPMDEEWAAHVDAAAARGRALINKQRL